MTKVSKLARKKKAPKLTQEASVERPVMPEVIARIERFAEQLWGCPVENALIKFAEGREKPYFWELYRELGVDINNADERKKVNRLLEKIDTERGQRGDCFLGVILRYTNPEYGFNGTPWYVVNLLCKHGLIRSAITAQTVIDEQCERTLHENRKTSGALFAA